MRGAEERVVERELEHLRVGHLGKLLPAIADISPSIARHPVEDALALAVPDIGPLAAHDDACAASPERAVIGEWVQMVESVELSQLGCLVSIGHL
jgi:hypothetical protein